MSSSSPYFNNSNNPKKRKAPNNSYEKEQEVLKQQRIVAARLAASTRQQHRTDAETTTTTTKTDSKPSNSQHPPVKLSSCKQPPATAAPANKQAALLHQQQQKAAVQQALQRSAIPSSASSSKQKRPSAARGRISSSTPTTNAAAILQAARSKAAKDLGLQKPVMNETRKSIVRKTTSLLNQLVSASATSNGSSAEASAHYGRVEPEDFWRNLRDWDFLSQFVKQKFPPKEEDNSSKHKGDGASGESGGEASKQKKPSPKPLPDTFINHRHYIASWSPLCLAEARAQLLSESLSYGGKIQFIPVSVHTHRNHRQQQQQQNQQQHSFATTTMDSIHVIIKPNKKLQKNNNNNPQFYPNDVCLLVPWEHESLVTRAMSQGAEPYFVNNLRSYGLVGHTEYARRSVDGLVLKVSKKWWAKTGTEPDYGLYKIGSNITALREFTALTRTEDIPLQRYLLGQHLQTKDNSSNKDGDNMGTETARTEPSSKRGNKAAMLDKMGGVKLLGKGFTAYAQRKFNPSQLAAISAAAQDYGGGGFTLVKGPPGTGKTTTLVAVLNSLHIRQFNKYYEEVKKSASAATGNRQAGLANATSYKPRILVCAPSNAAIDNVILKIMEDGFVDGSGNRYNPSMIRVGVGQSTTVKDVALENQVDAILSDHMDLAKVEATIASYKMELQRIQLNILSLRKRIHAIANASLWPLSKDWEIRIDDSFETTGRVYFVNHKEKTTSYECPPPPEPDEHQFPATAMPEYRAYVAKIVKLVEAYNSITTKLQRSTISQGHLHGATAVQVRQQLETHILDSVHIVMTTLGTAGNKTLESAQKFEVVVVDEAAQSVEPSILSALQLGSKHAILVGDPQQLPATIFNVSGRNTKYDRSLFQRLEEAGSDVYMLNQQYRMHPKISFFPRKIFYGGNLEDGPNVVHPEYGNPLRRTILTKVQAFHPFTILDLDSKEERGGTSLANSAEAYLAVHLYTQLRKVTNGLSAQSRVAVITPYSQQAALLRRTFEEQLGKNYTGFVEINTVDAFQGREANIVIFSCVRAAGSKGIGFLSDVRRMNVALTRAKHFLFVIARCRSIVVNPYWRDLVRHAKESNAVVNVPMTRSGGKNSVPDFPQITDLDAASKSAMKTNDPRKRGRSNSPIPSTEGRAKDPRRAPEPPKRKNSADPRLRKANMPGDPRNQQQHFGLAMSNDPRRNPAFVANAPMDPFGSANPVDPRGRMDPRGRPTPPSKPVDPRDPRNESKPKKNTNVVDPRKKPPPPQKPKKRGYDL